MIYSDRKSFKRDDEINRCDLESFNWVAFIMKYGFRHDLKSRSLWIGTKMMDG